MKKSFLIFIFLVVFITILTQLMWFTGKNYYQRPGVNIGKIVELKSDETSAINVFLEKLYFNEKTSIFYVFGIVEFDSNHEKFKYININCIGLSIGPVGGLSDSRAEVFDKEEFYQSGIDLPYSKESYDSWKLIDWSFPSNGLSVAEFLDQVRTSANLFKEEAENYECEVLSNKPRSL